MFYAQASSEQARTYILLKEKHLTMNGFIMIFSNENIVSNASHYEYLLRQAQTFISIQFNQKNRCENKNYLHERLANDPLKAVLSISIVKRFGWGLTGWGLAWECSSISSLLTTRNSPTADSSSVFSQSPINNMELTQRRRRRQCDWQKTNRNRLAKK